MRAQATGTQMEVGNFVPRLTRTGPDAFAESLTRALVSEVFQFRPSSIPRSHDEVCDFRDLALYRYVCKSEKTLKTKKFVVLPIRVRFSLVFLPETRLIAS